MDENLTPDTPASPGRVHTNALRIVNGTPGALHVTFNPWRKFFWLPPSAGFELRQGARSQEYLEVDVDDRGLWVFGAHGATAELFVAGTVEQLAAVPRPERRSSDPRRGWPGVVDEPAGAGVGTAGFYVSDDRTSTGRVVVAEADGVSTRHPLREEGTPHGWADAVGWPDRSPVLEVRPGGLHLAGTAVRVTTSLW